MMNPYLLQFVVIYSHAYLTRLKRNYAEILCHFRAHKRKNNDPEQDR